MNLRFFTAMYGRSALVFVLVFWLPVLLGVHTAASKFTELGLVRWYFPQNANAFLVSLPLLVGFLVGVTIVEVQNGRFSWTLPNIRIKFSRATTACGIIVAGAATWLHHSLGGGVPLPSAMALAALVYVLMIRAQVGAGESLTETRFGLVALGTVLTNPLADWGSTHPLLIGGLALAGSAVILRGTFRPDRHRQLTSGQGRSLTSGFSPDPDSRPSRGFGLIAPRESLWPQGHLGKGTASWVRALEHEDGGDSRLGVYNWPLKAIGISLATCAFLASVGVWGRPTLAATLLAWSDLHNSPT